MTEHIELDHGDILHAGFTKPIQQLLGTAQVNFRLQRVNASTIKVSAGTENSQVGIAVKGRYRWRTTEITAALPGGLPDGEHPVFVTATANDFTGPIEEPDITTHTFGLEIKKAGETPATALYREVGKVSVLSGAITAVSQSAGQVTGPMIETGALSNEGDIQWEREPSGGFKPILKNRAASIIETEESRTSNSFGSMATEDKATITLTKAGLMEITLIAQIKSQNLNAGQIAIFINGVQAEGTSGGIPLFAKSIAQAWTFVCTAPEKLIAVESGAIATPNLQQIGVQGEGAGAGGSKWVYRAPAGTYTVTLKYLASTGQITAKNRCLYVEGKEFH